MSHPPEHYAKLMIEDLDLEDEIDQLNSLQLLQTLQKVPVDQIVARNGMFEKFMFMSVPWKPLVDAYASKPFIPYDPKILISEGDYNKVSHKDYTQCVNFKISVSLGFYVKSILWIIEVQELPFTPTYGLLWILFIW